MIDVLSREFSWSKEKRGLFISSCFSQLRRLLDCLLCILCSAPDIIENESESQVFHSIIKIKPYIPKTMWNSDQPWPTYELYFNVWLTVWFLAAAITESCHAWRFNYGPYHARTQPNGNLIRYIQILPNQSNRLIHVSFYENKELPKNGISKNHTI